MHTLLCVPWTSLKHAFMLFNLGQVACRVVTKAYLGIVLSVFGASAAL